MPAHADLIVTNARILTMDEDNRRAEAIAIRNCTILAVGDRRTIDGHTGPSTRVIDAGGNTVVPGFIEAHMHLFAGAAELQICSCSGCTGSMRCRMWCARTRPSIQTPPAAGAGCGLHDPVDR